jgi:hypothetical protein
VGAVLGGARWGLIGSLGGCSAPCCPSSAADLHQSLRVLENPAVSGAGWASGFAEGQAQESSQDGETEAQGSGPESEGPAGGWLNRHREHGAGLCLVGVPEATPCQAGLGSSVS